MAPSMGRRNMTKRECSETSEPSALAEAAIQEICARLNLGLPAGTPIAVNGGLLHRMWRLETSTGVYAVKDLNPEIIAHPGVPEVYRVSERIVRSVAAAGVRAVPALQQQGDPLLTLSDRSVLVFPWFEGTSVPEDAVTPGEGRRIGEVLARLHDLHIDPKGLERPDDSAPPDESWRDLFARGATLEQVWARDPEARLRELTSWTRRSKEGADELDSNLVVSHRDLDQKNVMWDSQGEPCLIDWESAGLISPNVELFEVALYWSGQRIGPPNRDVFQAVLASYLSIRPAVQIQPRAAMARCLGGWLNWLHYNVGRSLGDTDAGIEERELGASEATTTLGTLRRLAAGIDIWASWT